MCVIMWQDEYSKVVKVFEVITNGQWWLNIGSAKAGRTILASIGPAREKGNQGEQERECARVKVVRGKWFIIRCESKMRGLLMMGGEWWSMVSSTHHLITRTNAFLPPGHLTDQKACWAPSSSLIDGPIGPLLRAHSVTFAGTAGASKWVSTWRATCAVAHVAFHFYPS